LGALLLGYYDGNDLVYAGKVGTGFDEATLRNLHDRLSPIEQDAPSFTRGLVRESGARWVHPQLVAQIGFTEWTRDGKLRHPRYQGLRTDTGAADVVRETR
jgi:ATP-dependent DNA ligase